MHAGAQQRLKTAAGSPQPVVHTPASTAVYKYNILPGANGNYGYDILKNNVVILHQPAGTSPQQSIPFKSSIQATRAAMYVIYKMKNNMQPLTLSNDELRKITIN